MKIKLIFCIIITAFSLVIFSGCENSSSTNGNNGSRNTLTNGSFTYNNEISFKNIPGITEEEIKAIEELQRQRSFFTYGMIQSTETFREFGEIRGFSALISEWLSRLFDIQFIPVLYEWNELIAGLESLQIDFTGELTSNEERRRSYNMTDPIANRSIKYIRLMGSPPLQNIITSRTPRYAFLQGSVTRDYVDTFTRYSFDSVLVESFEAAYNVLLNGEADAFFADSSMEAIFDIYDDLISNDFFPVIGMPVSLTTQNQELLPIISAVQKALENGADEYLAQLHELGKREHQRHRLYIRLNAEEREFLRSSPVIPYAAEYFNYPISFYNRHDRQWQGIYFDILDELAELTGLQFQLVNNETDDFPILLQMLERGEVSLISELLQSEARMGRFRWLTTPTAVNNYALLSKSETPNVSINDVLNMRVGIQTATAYADMFNEWFPLHPNTVEYEGSTEALTALGRGEVDLVMSSQIHLLALTNYYELSGYKANLIFTYAAESYIGFNIDEAILCSIIDKAFTLIDVQGISSQWASITFDYQARLLQQQRPWLIGAIVLSFMVLVLMSVLFARSRSVRKELDKLVMKRTAELEVATSAANAANKSKSSFLANMSHEIRTPMNTILGVTEIMLQDESMTEAEEARERLNKIYSSCNMLLGIINDILDFSKIEAGKLDIMPAMYYMASLINDSIRLNMMKIGDKPIEFELQIEEKLPAKFKGDELRIKQILNNLLSNAFKYTNEGKVIFSISCEPINNKEAMLILCVKDTGRGMNEEQLKKLFSEYSRFDEESNRTIEGTGLGLSITQRLVHLMNGEIHAESEPNKGSLFCVRLPQGIIDSDVLGTELISNLKQFRMNDMFYTKRSQISRDPMPYGRVLVVDDVETNLYVAEGLLKPYKLNIETVNSGYAAIDKVHNNNNYDIIFMDHMMPGMDGIEATKRLRAMGYNSSIVALTANAVAGQADIFLENGFDDFISKPIDLRQLNSVLNKLIRDKQPEEVLKAARSQIGKNEKNIDRKLGLTDYSGKTMELLIGSVAKHLLQNEFDKAEQVIALYTADSERTVFNVKDQEIPGMDIQKGLEKFDGEQEIYIKVLSSYTNSIRPLLDIMESFLEIIYDKPLNEDALVEYQRAAHSIKGTSLDIFAESIGKKAAELESAAKTKDLSFIEKESPELLVNLQKLVLNIENMLILADTKHTKTRKNRIDKELLVKLLGYCKDYDMDGVDNIMEEIEKFQYDNDEGLCAWLRENIDVVDFDAIAEKLGSLHN